MDFTIERRGGYFEIRLTGRPAVDGFAAWFDALLARADWHAGSSVLVDETELQSAETTVQEIRDIAEVCGRRRAGFGASRAAIVVSRDLEYGLNRMWSVFVEGQWDVEAALFRARDEALAWLTD